MATPSTTRLADMLKRTGLFKDEQIKALLEQKIEGNTSITRRVVEAGYVPEEAFLTAVGKAMGYPFVCLNEVKIESAVLTRLPAKVVFQYNVIPLQIENSVLRVATNDPFNSNLADALRLVSGLRIRLSLSLTADIAKAINKFYGVGADTMERLIEDNRIEVPREEIMAKVDLSDLDQEASIVKFVNQVVWEAYKDRATDIHFEPMEDELRIRYRVDGVLHQTSMPPQLKRFQAAIVSRIKVMANMDIAEKRLPQDGRIGLSIHGEDLDIRVSTIPTVYGESVSLRLLTRKSGLLGLESIGMNPKDEAIIRKLIYKPNGILLVTGPTGSGKSTTLYACLHTINSIEQRIITVEEPIEYEMKGINQIQVRSEIGLTFAMGLRHILRQDPDVIMVGEIRDFETAEIAIRASLTGHLVFSTLHTNDSAGAITRLIDMGVEPFLVASSVEAIVAQRLLRILCDQCKRPLKPDNPVLKSIASVKELIGCTVYEAVGCEKCRQTGYLGRLGIFENLLVTDAIRPLIVSRESANMIKQKGLQQGMQTLRDDGWVKVRNGTTTIEEVLRVTEEEEI
ncbi:MAG: Flp pilus assembly complex ATPase component TadA [Verrucomicrobia bacterium]|nr:Flp pilus assembly complex ATPase component TadA [Verrucomicrobiota bacterium]MBU4286242.1 Flp pilus assembly complex ATPase component TadA [Verrucomicrobiota bacterium]